MAEVAVDVELIRVAGGRTSCVGRSISDPVLSLVPNPILRERALRKGSVEDSGIVVGTYMSTVLPAPSFGTFNV